MGKIADHLKGDSKDAKPPMVRVNKDLYLAPVNPNNIGTFKCLTKKLLQVDYTDEFYSKLANSASSFIRLAFFKDIAIGSICSRLQETSEGLTLYIMTIGVLPMFERRGIGTEMVNFVMETARKKNCVKARLHVWTKNPTGKDFYERKLGFEVIEEVAGYYQKLTPSSAYLLEKSF